jgi:hypothetical protein
MNGRVTSVSAALELLVPPFEPSSGDWDAIVRQAGAANVRHRPLVTRRRAIAAAIAIAVIATLLATPAFGLLVDLIGRVDVPFAGKAAPLEVKRDFYDLGLGLPSSIAPQAIASQSRRVASFSIRGRVRVLYVAPTRDGGYCWEITRSMGGCTNGKRPTPPHRTSPGYVHPELLGLSYDQPTSHGVPYVATIAGDVRSPKARSLEVDFADGTKQVLPFYFVSKPIDAGFFYASIRGGHDTGSTRAVAVVLRDRRGAVLSRQPFYYPTRRQLAKERARQKALLQWMRTHHRQRPAVYGSPPLPPPTEPVQRGAAGGVTAVAGANGVVVFDTSHASPSVRKLIGGPVVTYACIGRLPYNLGPVSLGFPRTTVARVAIRLRGRMSPPLLGCEIQGGYGHRWPDRNDGHSAVEIAFTPAGTRYFEDRAAARDLALFLRSRRMHELRTLSGGALADALKSRYGSALTELGSTRAKLPARRIGYVTKGSATTYVEYSTTGRGFYVRVEAGRIRGQNLKPLAFVF